MGSHSQSSPGMSTNEGPSEQVRLHFKCDGILSKCNPMVIVKTKEKQDDEYTEVGRTEYTKNNQNPSFSTQIAIEFFSERKQYLEFLVVDIDKDRQAVDQERIYGKQRRIDPADGQPYLRESFIQEYGEEDGKRQWANALPFQSEAWIAGTLGSFQTRLATVVNSKNKTLSADLTMPSSDFESKEEYQRAGTYGSITVTALASGPPKCKLEELLVLHIRGRNLANKDGPMGKSDPYMVIKRKPHVWEEEYVKGEYVKVLRTETIDNDLNPLWAPISINLFELCEGDLDAPLLIEVWDSDTFSSDDQIGFLETTVNQLLMSQPQGTKASEPQGATERPEVELRLEDYKPGRNLECGCLSPVYASIFPSGKDATAMIEELKKRVEIERLKKKSETKEKMVDMMVTGAVVAGVVMVECAKLALDLPDHHHHHHHHHY